MSVLMTEVQLLLSHGADPNQRDSLGNTPLHLGKKEQSSWPLKPVSLWSLMHDGGFTMTYKCAAALGSGVHMIRHAAE